MAFPHTNERLARVKEVYRNARPLSLHLAHPFRTEYQLRKGNIRSFSLYAPTLGVDDDSDASDDEYVPETPRKRRQAAPKPPSAKRARSSTDQEKHLDELPTTPQSLRTTTTLDLEIPGDLNSQDNRIPRRLETTKGFLDKQNEESEKIGAGTTRSGLQRNMDGPVLHPGCATCKEDYKRCSARYTGVYPCERCHALFLDDCSPVKKTKEPDGTSSLINNDNAPMVGPSRIRNPPSFSISNSLPSIKNPNSTVVLGSARNNSATPNSGHGSSQSANKQGTFVIKTVWAHPIDFKTSPDVCHFCRDFRYGLYGYGSVKAEVFRVNGEAGLQEAAQGHRSQGKEATRMCFRCALHRLYVSRCKTHKLDNFMDPDTNRFAHYMTELNGNHLREPFIPRGVYYTCWVCTQPAFFRCVTMQSRDIFGNSLEKMGKGKIKGCGAFFCESCANNIAADNGHLTRATVNNMGLQVPRRADLEFLFAGSLLHQAYK